MLYGVYLWTSRASQLPDVEAQVTADDPLEATFLVMRSYRFQWVYFAWVFLGAFDGVGVAEYSEITCPDREVC